MMLWIVEKKVIEQKVILFEKKKKKRGLNERCLKNEGDETNQWDQLSPLY